MNIESPEGRVAMLFSALGLDPSHEAFQALPSDPMNRVSELMRQYQQLPPDEDEVDALLSEFLRMLRFAKQNLAEEDEGSTKKATVPFPEDDDPMEDEGPFFQPTGDAFRDIRRLRPVQVAGALRNEQPRTIATVLAVLTPERAGAILQHLPPETQGPSFLLLRDPPKVPPAMLNRILQATVEKGCRLGDDSIRDPEEETYRKLAEMLRSMDQAERAKILLSLAEEDPDTLDRLRKLLFVFTDVLRMSDRSIQKLLAEIDSSTLTTALKNADEEYRKCFTNNLSKRARATLLEELEYMDKVKPDEEAAAREAIADAIAQLDQRGDLEME